MITFNVALYAATISTVLALLKAFEFYESRRGLIAEVLWRDRSGRPFNKIRIRNNSDRKIVVSNCLVCTVTKKWLLGPKKFDQGLAIPRKSAEFPITLEGGEQCQFSIYEDFIQAAVDRTTKNKSDTHRRFYIFVEHSRSKSGKLFKLSRGSSNSPCADANGE